jgi:hypothetical protein
MDGSIRNYDLPEEDVLVAKQELGMNSTYTYYEFVTPSVRQVVQNQFGCYDMKGAKFESQQTRNSCIGAHFD